MKWMLPVLLVAACVSNGPQPQEVCTLIGCNDGLSIQVHSTLAQPMTITVRAENQVIGTFRCDVGTQCASFIENQTPVGVNVTIDVAGRTLNRSYTPEYRIARPNGERCPPACRQATITVNVS